MLRTGLRSAFVSSVVVLVACGGSEDPGTVAAPSGSAGAGGGSIGSAGQAGKPAGAGAAGATGGKAGGGASGAGAGGSSGSTAGGAGGGGGGSGTGGKATGGGGGSGGVGGAGGGSAGSAGMPAEKCVTDTDCQGLVPETTPPTCARGLCDPGTKTCRFVARDKDGDGHTGAKCAAKVAGYVIVTGDDCDDTDPDSYPNAWDGPKGDGQVDRCDGVDQNCNGIVDDGKLANDTTCNCSPADVRACAEDSSGKPFPFPKVDTTGKPYGLCKFGAQTCGQNGKWGPCTGGVGPATEECNGKDDDCDGATDEDVVTAPLWVYDGDDDFHASISCPKLRSCGEPNELPKCDVSGCATCGPKSWKLASEVTADDCDDKDKARHPGVAEICDGIDNNCDGAADPSCACKKGDTFVCNAGHCNELAVLCDPTTGQYPPCAQPDPKEEYFWDGDSDGFSPIGWSPLLACAAPTGCPTELPGCGMTKWKLGALAQDCDDTDPAIRPGVVDICDGKDNDCNGAPDPGCACILGQQLDCNTLNCNPSKVDCKADGTFPACPTGVPKQKWMYDGDGDGHGARDWETKDACANPKTCPKEAPQCSAPMNWTLATANVNDCRDDLGSVHPGVSELCNDDGRDENCNDAVNEGCACTNGVTRICGAALVTGAQCGTETCANGVWPGCVDKPHVCPYGWSDWGNGHCIAMGAWQSQTLWGSQASGILWSPQADYDSHGHGCWIDMTWQYSDGGCYHNYSTAARVHNAQSGDFITLNSHGTGDPDNKDVNNYFSQGLGCSIHVEKVGDWTPPSQGTCKKHVEIAFRSAAPKVCQ